MKYLKFDQYKQYLKFLNFLLQQTYIFEKAPESISIYSRDPLKQINHIHKKDQLIWKIKTLSQQLYQKVQQDKIQKYNYKRTSLQYIREETTFQYILQSSLSGISILCCLVVTIGFIAFKNLRRSALKLVLFLCISEMVFSVSMITRSPNQKNNQQCAAQIFFGNLGHLSTLFWTCMISYSLRRSIQLGYDHVRGVMKKIILTSLVVPTTLAGLILLRQYYFTGNDFCSVLQEGIEGTKSTEGGYSFFIEKLIMLLEFQIPIYISFIFNLLCIIKVSRITKENNIPNINLKLRRVYLYPFIVPICQIFSFIYQIYVLCGGDPWNSNLITLNIIFGCSQGAINSIVYGFNQKLKLSFQNAYSNRKSGVSTSLNESLLQNSGNFESPERRVNFYKQIAKAYQTSSEDEDDEKFQNSKRLIKNAKDIKQSLQNKHILTNSMHNESFSDFNEETHYNSLRKSQKTQKQYQSDQFESDHNNEIDEFSEDLIDDMLSTHSTGSKQFQLTIADF